MDNQWIKTSQHFQKELFSIAANIPSGLKEETMDMQESSSKRQSTSPWQELHSPTQSTLESTPQVLQRMEQLEHKPGKKPNTKCRVKVLHLKTGCVVEDNF